MALIVTAGGNASAAAQARGAKDPIAHQANDYALSAPVSELAGGSTADSAGPAPPRVNPLADEPDNGRRGTATRGEPPRDPLAASTETAPGRTPPPGLGFDGTGNPLACGGCLPPDTIGDVGPSNYIQMVNATKVAIYDKSGTLLEPVFDLGDLWTSGPCTDNFGDPVVLYDPLADRWLLSQFHGSPNRLCFAISTTSDPTGTYHLFEFTTPAFPDYFKVGVWPTGYYVSANESTYTAYAFDRAKMLAGDPTASFVRFAGQTNFLLPADVDGSTPPSPQGGLFYTFKDNTFHGGADRIELFRLNPDFATPANSTFTLEETFPITAFTYTVCGFFVLDCIPQPGTAEGLDPVGEWPMHRFAYRSLPGREALVGNFTVGGGSATPGAAIRWFELRDTGSGWALFQEGTHDPGPQNRWMGSIAMDQAGNIALGYSVSTNMLFPSIRYATRSPGDPPGTLQAEQTLHAGSGSQTSNFNRWGDYSAMSVDPADECTFWFTNEYYGATSVSTWSTRIGNFVEPSCLGPPPDRTLTVSTAGSGTGTVTGPGINCPGDCTESYPDGTAVSLTATPTGGSSFGGFSGACTGATCNLTMDANKAVTATFDAPPPDRTLTVSTAGAGTGTVTGPGINCPGDCTESYPDGTAVSLTATPTGSSTFDGFSGACSGATCNLTMNADKAVTAGFSPTSQTPRTLTVSTAGTGTGTVTGPGISCPGDCTESYPDGTAVSLTATPTGSSTFDGFSGACTGATCNLTMDSEKSVTAGFSLTELVPPNDIEIGKPKLNKKKGTAKLPVEVMAAGELKLAGKGVKSASKNAAGPGKVNLPVKPKGKVADKLDDKGKAKVTPKVSFTPTGGTENTESKKVTLKEK